MPDPNDESLSPSFTLLSGTLRLSVLIWICLDPAQRCRDGDLMKLIRLDPIMRIIDE